MDDEAFHSSFARCPIYQVEGDLQYRFNYIWTSWDYNIHNRIKIPSSSK